MSLDAFEKAGHPEGMLPDRIEHIEVATPDDVARFKSLGIAASMQPIHATCCVGDYVISRVGEERMPVRRQSMWDHLSLFLRDTFLPVLSPV